MLKRVITGSFLVAAVVGLFFLRTVDYRLFNILAFLMCSIGAYEMLHALKDRLSFLQKTTIAIYALAIVPVFTFVGALAVAVITFAAAILVFASLVIDFHRTDLNAAGLSLVSIFYPSTLIVSLLIINAIPGYKSFIALLLVFVVASLSDVFAYLIGSWLKGPKLCPNVSPKKTISGAVGGVIGGILGGLIVWLAYGKGALIPSSVVGELFAYLGIGAIGGAITEFGDLVEGAIKRKIGIKDMGYFLPGHGGMLDRIDGIIFNSIFILFVFYAFF